MRKPRLAPGEREEAALHPAFASYWPWHLAALAFAGAGAALWALLASDGWAAGSQGPAWRFWNYLYGNPWTAYLLVLSAFAAAGFVFRAALRRWWPVAAFGAAGAAAVGLTAAFAHPGYRTWLPLLVAAFTVPALLLAELDRRSRTYHLTNLRLVAHGGLVRRREESLHHDGVVDIDWRRGVMARAFGYATPIVVLRSRREGPEPRLPGFHPYPRLRRLLELSIQRATAGEEVRGAAGLDAKAADAMADLHRAGRSERL